MSPRSIKVLKLASVLALVALALMMWGVVDPRPLPVLVGLMIGQGLGTLSFLLYLVVIGADLRISRKLRPAEADVPPEPPAA